MEFRYSGFQKGFQLGFPIALSVFAYGLVFGMLAQKVGMTTLESLFMSVFVFAGAAQFLSLDLWSSPVPILALVTATLVINLRHLLMGASLQPWFSKISPLKAYGSLFFMADENWALTIRHFKKGEKDAAFLLGSGFAVFVCWFCATWIGHLGGAFITKPETYGLDFAFTAVFVALLVSLWRGKTDLIPWVFSAILSVISEKLLPGKWYILIGGLGGSILAVLRYKEVNNEH